MKCSNRRARWSPQIAYFVLTAVQNTTVLNSNSQKQNIFTYETTRECLWKTTDLFNKSTSVPLFIPGGGIRPMCEISIRSLSPQHHHRSRLQSWLHTQPNMPHLLFSRHTRCSPTPSPIIMPLSLPHPRVWLPRAGVAHMRAAAGLGSGPPVRG